MAVTLRRRRTPLQEGDREAGACDDGLPYVRSLVDGVRALIGAAFLVGGTLLATVFDSTLLGLATDSTVGLARLPAWSRDLAGSVMASMVIVATVALAIRALLTTRYRRFALYSAGIAVSAGVALLLGRFVYGLVDESVQRAFAVDVPVFRVVGPDDTLNPADPLLAASVATLTIAASYLTQQVIRRAIGLVAVYALASTLTISAPPLTLLTDFGAGLLVGSLLLWTFGRHDPALRPHEILAALADAGVEAVDLEARSTASGNEWLATQADGDQLVVTALSRDDRSSALLTRLVRWLRVRKTGDQRPFVSLRRSVEHRALVALHARNCGIDTPTIRAVAPAGVDGMVLARDVVRGADTTPSATVGEYSEQTLRSIWRQAARLQRAHVAHGRLRLACFVVDAEDRPWLIGFERGELAANEQRLGTDLAELLASTAASIGLDRAVDLAADTVGTPTLERSVPWLQPLALTSSTRSSISADDLEELRNITAATCGLEPEPPVRLERVDRKSVFVLGTIVLSAWFLLPQLTDLDNIWSEISEASWEWALLAVVFSVGTYVAATTSLLGAIPVRLAFWPALTAQVASSFANRVTPAKVGGLATNLRYFQRKGVPVAVSATAVGLNAIAGVIMHIALTLCALLLASGDGQSAGLSIPSAGMILLVGAVLGSTALVGAAIPSTRRLFATHVVPQLRTGWDALIVVIHDSGRLLMLFGGAALITLCYLAAMVASLKAFGSSASLPFVALLFLTGSAVANAAPTPGGLGATEAALIGALSTIEQASIVVPAVFLYRLVTFWLPILPGWIALTHLRRKDDL